VRRPPVKHAPPVNNDSTPRRPWPTSIRVRLGFALALALFPVLILSALESAENFRHERKTERAELASAADRSASTARARIAAAEVLLQTLTPGSVGLQCAARLSEIKGRIDGYANLIRFDSIGRVACAADSVPADPQRRDKPWFHDLAGGKPMSVTSVSAIPYADQPALLASVRAETADGRFDGALTAVITLASLRPDKADRSLPEGSEVALVDASGRYLSATRTSAFPGDLAGRLSGRARSTPGLWFGPDRTGADHVFSIAPLVDQDVYVVLSAPAPGLVSWVWLNPVSALVLPVLAFVLALIAVLSVADHGVLRWITYLRRIAGLYARGRYSVHPYKAATAPPEIRDLAEALDVMAETIAARDAALKESLTQKDDLMREIHHRVKNNLQVISSLLNLQQRTLSDPAARAAISDTRQRIAALALIYRSLYQSADLKRVDLRDFLDELIAHLIMGDSVAAGLIRTELVIEPLIIDPDRLAPLALFAVEAITNAKKHGLGETGGSLCVSFHVHGVEAELTIADTGRPGEAVVIGEGVGHTLMVAFARQLRGQVAFTPNPDGGLTTRLVFPTPELARAA
jgi:two-component sensor histidine kinase